MGARQGGLEARVVTVALVSTIAALLAAFSVYQWRNWNADRAELAGQSIRLAHAIAAAAHRDVAAGDSRAATALLNGSEHAVAAAYMDLAGHSLRLGKVAKAGGAPRALGVTAPQARFRAGGLEVRVPHYEAGRRVGELVLWVDDREVLTERLTNISIALLLSLVATLGAGLVARRFARRALAPLHALNAGMDAVTASRDFSARLPVAREDEVGQLTHGFNRLLDALREYDASLHNALSEATAARDAAERANVLKAQFLANVGHELRTPLNGVLGMTQVLLLDDLTPTQREQVEVIRGSGSALLAVLNDVLDLAEVEAGSLRIATERFDLEEVVLQACEAAVTLAESKGLTLEVDIADSARGGWTGDPVRLRQVLYNIIANGLKFTARGGVRVRAEAGAGDAGLVLSVADTGIGIPAEALPHLFEKFVQGEGGATRRFGGAGLGLSICRNLVTLMGGTIAVESATGRGSTFTVMLPLARATAAAGAEVAGETATARDLGGLRVLVAEDNETNQRVVRTVLNALGVDPVMVPDGRAAVEAWGRGAWDLVLMDIQMPVRDGVSATRDIRRLEAERGLEPTRIVALTANAMPAQADEYAAAGMDGVVAKPIVIEKLHAALLGARTRRAAA